jgi:sec-independent protein translocase protein TatC
MKAEEPALQEKRFTLTEHLRELRRRLIYFVGFLAGVVALSFIFEEEIMRIIRAPHENAMKALSLEAHLIALDYSEKFMAYFKLNLIASLIVAAPFGLWQAWEFIGAGLRPREKKAILLYFPLSLILFAAGVFFGYFYLIPIALRFLAMYGDTESIKLFISLTNYLSLFLMLTLALGLSFELPLVMLFFSAIGLVSAGFYLSKWRLAILLIFILSAVITPTGDPLTMTVLALPLIGLYGLGILLSRLAQKPAAAK